LEPPKPDAWAWSSKYQHKGHQDLTDSHPLEFTNYMQEELRFTKPFYSSETIQKNLPMGVNSVRIICQNCGHSGFISKQVTDGYTPYCPRCGQQSLEEGKEESLFVKSKIREVFSEE